MIENSKNVTIDAGQAVSDKANNKGVGALLRESRESNDQTLGDIATILRIRQPYLEALEDGRFSDLPGQTYAVGFIRGYAEYLGLDSTEVVRRFKNEVMPEPASAHLRFPVPLVETGVPSGTLIFLGFIAIVLSYGAWLLNTTEDGFFSNLVSPLPERFANLLPDAEKLLDANENKMVIASGLEKANKISIASESKEGARPESSSAPKTINPGSVDRPVDHLIEPNSEQLAERELSPRSKSPPIASSQSMEQLIETKNDRLSLTPGFSDLQKKDVEAVSAISEPLVKIVTGGGEFEGGESQVSSAPDSPASILTSEKTPPLSGTSTYIENPSEASLAPDISPEMLASSEPPSVSELTVETLTSPELSTQAPASADSATSVAELSLEGSPPKSRITVKAIANSWIEIRDDFSNTNLMARLLSKGDSYDVPNQAGLSLHTGNAGALQIMVDGALVPGIGEVGAVQRGVQLDPDALLAGTAAQ